MPSGYYKKTGLPYKQGFKKENKLGKLTKGIPRPNISGDKSHRWKGEEVGYRALHDWVVKWKGTPDACEMCGKTGLKGHQIQWANIDHLYRRVLEDYIRMCAFCHRKYDIEHNNYESGLNKVNGK
jgi:hypothetical protein